MTQSQPTRQSESNRARGFSLIEVAVILMAIGIITAFVVPQAMSWMRLYRLGIGARNVATALQRARYLATSNNTRVGISIPEPLHVRVEQYSQTTNADAQLKALIDMPNGVSIDSQAPRQVAFDGRGIVTPMPNDNVTIRVNSIDGSYQTVIVSPTGQVTISDVQKS